MWSVEVVSHETIKPSSPTPPHLTTHKLSWLDRMVSPVTVSIVLFYSEAGEETVPILKKSLSETLALFYPFAGRLNPNDTSVVDCNDEGVDLYEARAVAEAPLSLLLNRRFDHADLIHLLPPIPMESSSTSPLLSLQVTVFEEGHGIAIGTCFSHTLADGHSFWAFVAAWASTARGDSCSVELPLFDGASRFPTSSDPEAFAKPEVPKGKQVSRRFVFEEPAIDALRESPAGHPPPTRVVAVAALMWRSCVRAREAATASGSPSVFAIAVNMRGKAAALPESLFGNVCLGARAVAAPPAVVAERNGKAKRRSEEKLMSAIRKRDGQWVRRVQGVDGWLVVQDALAELLGELCGGGTMFDYYYFSSWTRFRFYEADFGWGKPLLVAPARLFRNNLVVLMGRGTAGGMEAWIKAEEAEMEELERDEELMSFACPAYN